MNKISAKPVAILIDEISKRHLVLLNIKGNQSKNGISFAVDRADIDKDHHMIDLLKNYGVQLPQTRSEAISIIEKCIRKRLPDLKTRSLVHKTGWSNDNSQFALSSKTIGRSKMLAFHVDRLTQRGNRRHNPNGATLENWKKEIRPICSQSQITIFVTTLAFCGPVLRWLLDGPDLPLFNLRQTSSCGKTSALMLASTVFGGISTENELFNFNHTDRALEEELAGYNDLFLAVDEESNSNANSNSRGDVLKKFAFTVAGGRGRARSNEVSSRFPQATWKCAIVTSSNQKTSSIDSEEETNNAIGVRWIDLLINSKTRGGIFDVKGCDYNGSQRSELIANALKSSLRNRGIAGEHWIKLLVRSDKREEIIKSAKSESKRFIEMHSAGLQNTQLRILSKFALVYSLAGILPKYDLVAWSKTEGEAAVTKTYQRYVNCHKSEYFNWDVAMVKLSGVVFDGDDFPEFSVAKKKWEKHQQMQSGFKTTFNNIQVACVHSDGEVAFAKVLGCSPETLKLTLLQRSILIKDASGKNSILTASPLEEGRKRFMAIDCAKLKSHAQKLKQRTAFKS